MEQNSQSVSNLAQAGAEGTMGKLGGKNRHYCKNRNRGGRKQSVMLRYTISKTHHQSICVHVSTNRDTFGLNSVLCNQERREGGGREGGKSDKHTLLSLEWSFLCSSVKGTPQTLLMCVCARVRALSS